MPWTVLLAVFAITFPGLKPWWHRVLRDLMNDSTLVLQDLKPVDKAIAGKPKSVVLLSDGLPVDYTFAKKTLTITLPKERRSELDAVVKIEF